MLIIRVQALISGQPQLNRIVRVYSGGGVSVPNLFSLSDDEAITNVFKTDSSGYLSFKIQSPQDLTFKLQSGLSLSPAYPLYDSSQPPSPPQVDASASFVCAELVLEGYAVKTTALGEIERLDAANPSHSNTIVGIARQTGNVGEVVEVINEDYITNSAWTWQFPKPVYAGISGTLTQNPTGLAFLQQIGVAVTANKIAVRISQPIKRG